MIVTVRLCLPAEPGKASDNLYISSPAYAHCRHFHGDFQSAVSSQVQLSRGTRISTIRLEFSPKENKYSLANVPQFTEEYDLLLQLKWLQSYGAERTKPTNGASDGLRNIKECYTFPHSLNVYRVTGRVGARKGDGGDARKGTLMHRTKTYVRDRVLPQPILAPPTEL